MSIQSAIEAELPRLRAEAEARMTDAFDIGVPTGGYVYDPESGEDVQAITPLFTTKGYIPPSSGASNLSQSTEVGGRVSLSARREIRIPWDSEAVPPDAIAVCTAVGPLTPPRMLGKRYRVGGSDGASQGTACHLEIVEVLS